jgi:hypothetical protein
VKIEGIRAPELNQPGGEEARQRLQKRIRSGELVVQRGGTDKYGRTLVRDERADHEELRNRRRRKMEITAAAPMKSAFRTLLAAMTRERWQRSLWLCISAYKGTM